MGILADSSDLASLKLQQEKINKENKSIADVVRQKAQKEAAYKKQLADEARGYNYRDQEVSVLRKEVGDLLNYLVTGADIVRNKTGQWLGSNTYDAVQAVKTPFVQGYERFSNMDKLTGETPEQKAYLQELGRQEEARLTKEAIENAFLNQYKGN